MASPSGLGHTGYLSNMLRSNRWLHIALATTLFFGQGVANCVCAPEEDAHEHHAMHAASTASPAQPSLVGSESATGVATAGHVANSDDGCCCVGSTDTAVAPSATAAPTMPIHPDLCIAVLASAPVVALHVVTYMPGIFGQDAGPPGQAPTSAHFGRAPPVA